MTGSIQQKVAVGVGLVSLIFCLAFGFVYNSINDSTHTRDKIFQSRQILQELNSILINITEAETGQRGYLLTQQPQYLSPYTTAIRQLQHNLDVLQGLAKQDLLLSDQLKLLEPVLNLKLNELQRTVVLNRTHGKEAALQVVMTNEGQKLMDEIHNRIAQTIYLENGVLQSRRQQSQYSQQVTYIALDVSGVVIFFLLGLVYWVVNRENTRREQAQRDLNQLNSVLQKNMALLDSIIENVPGMIFLKDAKELRFQLFNKAAEEVVGFLSEEVLGKNDYDFFPEAQADQFTHKDRETLRLKRLVDIEEEAISTRHGEIRILKTKKVPILDDKGNPAYLLGISQDITEFKQTQEHIEQLNARLERQVTHLNALNKELEAFSYSVSHDLRTPLRSIEGFSQAILESAIEKLDDTEKDYLHRVRNSSQQMAQLIDDILNLSRVTRAELNIEANVDLSEIARDIVKELQNQEPQRQVSVEIEDGILVKGDCGLLKVVLQNLIGNAWKFTSKQPNAFISFENHPKNGTPIYAVHDNGAGFNMAYAEKLFEAFQRLHANKEFPGTGIGLAIVQRIIARHRGQIWGDGDVGTGANFYFTLGNIQQEEVNDDHA